MWKLKARTLKTSGENVSVPLRGLIMWKLSAISLLRALLMSCFSPLTGINYVET